ncbi:MAG: hypothetical protein M3Y65_19870 [Pseudomonadota bacterium]|nr:hypothetical protein [Pseudomonadota bacterium]
MKFLQTTNGTLLHASTFPKSFATAIGPADCVFAYDPTYVVGDVREQVALGWPVDMERHSLAVWPAFLYDLVAQGNGRKFLLGQLGLGDNQAADRLPMRLYCLLEHSIPLDDCASARPSITSKRMRMHRAKDLRSRNCSHLRSTKR